MRTRSAGGAGSAAALTVVLALAGCGGGEIDAEGPVSPSTSTTSVASVVPPSSSPTASPDAPGTASASPSAASFPESDRILSQYRTFFAAVTRVSIMPDAAARAAGMSKLAVDPEYTALLSGMKASRDAGEVGYGDGALHPQLQSVTGGEATLVDCQDNSLTGRVKMATGKKVTQGRKDDLAQVTMKQGADGLWRVATVAYAAAGSCHANG